MQTLAKLPVTIVTGFLGAGKTTLLRHMLGHADGRRIAVIVNEFGELGIDGEILKQCSIGCSEEEANGRIFELANGCLCCTVQEEFFPVMRELVARRGELDHILIETSGLALPKPLVQAFNWPEIRNACTVDAVITVVDSPAVLAGTFKLENALQLLATRLVSAGKCQRGRQSPRNICRKTRSGQHGRLPSAAVPSPGCGHRGARLVGENGQLANTNRHSPGTTDSGQFLANLGRCRRPCFGQ